MRCILPRILGELSSILVGLLNYGCKPMVASVLPATARDRDTTRIQILSFSAQCGVGVEDGQIVCRSGSLDIRRNDDGVG